MTAPLHEQPLVIAIPSKGRLQENTAAFFARAGMPLSLGRGARDYRATIEGLPDVEVAFLSASDVVAQLASGAAHFGVTGEDLVREQIADVDATVCLLCPLGFGQARVVVAAPQGWIDVATMADIEDIAIDLRTRQGRKLRVATKYLRLTRNFFASHGITDYRIVESLGATEGAPAAGTAELIVDITTSGATLAANGLKPLSDGLILSSEANLVASLKADWGPRAQQAARTVLARVAAEDAGRALTEVRARLDAIDDSTIGSFIDIWAERHQARMPFGPHAPAGIVTLHCPRATAFALANDLVAAGAADVTMRGVDYVFRADNPLQERLDSRLPRPRQEP